MRGDLGDGFGEEGGGGVRLVGAPRSLMWMGEPSDHI